MNRCITVVTIVVAALVAVTSGGAAKVASDGAAKVIEKRDSPGYGGSVGGVTFANDLGLGAGGFGGGGFGGGGFGGGALSLDTSFSSAGTLPAVFAGGRGQRCRDETKYILTWTKAVIPVTLYDTRTEYLPTTLYKYTSETQFYPVTAVRLETTTRAGGSELGEETKIAYRTNTIVVPRVSTITNTLVFTEDEHVTVTATDRLTRTEAQQYPVTVTVTQTRRVPQIQTSVATEYQTSYQTEYESQHYNVVQTRTFSQARQQYLTQTETRVLYNTVARTRTVRSYQTVTKCQQQEQQGYPQAERY